MASHTGPAHAQPRTRASKETRRTQLIEATLDAIAEKGLTAVTLADVADTAGLSRGIVNFHFVSKEKLLYATLTHLSDEYDRNWHDGMIAAGPDAVDRMHALISADLAETICEPRKLAAWFGFFGAAASRPDYRDLCWARDDAYLNVLEDVCRALDTEAGYGIDPSKTAMAIYAMQEGLWLRLMLGSAELRRTDAIAIARGMLGTLFPDHFTPEGERRARG
ncbi:MAG: TetR family transcriptional regulator C-terminal domain-containing protein [Pseudomonadota bacterium]